jgi:hypothetical protein
MTGKAISIGTLFTRYSCDQNLTRMEISHLFFLFNFGNPSHEYCQATAIFW